MKKLKHLLLSRTSNIVVIILIVASILVGNIFPQSMTSSQFEIEKWKSSNPFWSSLYDMLGLGHVYTSSWFSVLLFLFLLMLLMSLRDQVKLAYKKTFKNGQPVMSGGINIPVSESEVIRVMKKYGYRRTYKGEESSRFIKHPLGYWGNVLLHLGIVIVIGSSLLITITETRGLLHLVEGETYLPGNQWVVEETGMMARRFVLPVAVRLDKVTAEFWETDDVKNISTIITLVDLEGKARQYDLGINRTIDDFGLRIYQGRRFGDAFYVTFVTEGGETFKSILQLESPPGKDKPGYGNFFIDGIPYMLKAKYYADADKMSMQSDDPLLVMRLVRSEKSIDKISADNENKGRLKMTLQEKKNVFGEVSLKLEERKPFGPYTAELIKASKWSGVIFVRSSGMSGIFTGFFIIMIGISLTYFMPPRECTVHRDEEGITLSWRASKFERFYEDEFEKISNSLGESGPS